MMIEEAIEYFKKCNERIRSTAIDENGMSKSMKETIDANNMAIKSFESLQTISNLFSKWRNGEIDDNEYFFQMQNILLFGKMLEGEVKE